jgi:hypothetical protein
MLIVLIYTLFVFFTPSFKTETSGFTVTFYLVYFLMNLANSVVSYLFYVSVGAFQARVSDKSLGGVCIMLQINSILFVNINFSTLIKTYMTFTSLWLSVGRSIINTPSLYLIDIFSKKSCIYSQEAISKNSFSSSNSTLVNLISQTTKEVSRVTKCSFNSDMQVKFSTFILLNVP